MTPEEWQRLAEDEARTILDRQPLPETPPWIIPLPEQAPTSGPGDCPAIF